MRIYKKVISKILVILLMLIPAVIYGQGKLAQTGLQFLQIGVSPRAEAMAGAYVLAGDNSEALFYNVAGITKSTTTFDVSLDRVQWFADIGYNALGVTFQPYDGKYGVFGLSFRNANYGDFYGTRVDAASSNGYDNTGIFSPTAYAIGLAYAKQLTDKFRIGGQVKYLKQTLGDNILTFGGPQLQNEVSGFAFDFGMIYSTGIRGFDFGMDIKNFAADFKYQQYAFEAPLTFRIGLSLNVFELTGLQDKLGQDLLIVADAVHPRDYGEHLNLGAEYKLYKMVSLRVGYKVNYSEESFTAGLGLNYDLSGSINMRVDYSYGAFGIWNNVQRFSLGFSL